MLRTTSSHYNQGQACHRNTIPPFPSKETNLPATFFCPPLSILDSSGESPLQDRRRTRQAQTALPSPGPWPDGPNVVVATTTRLRNRVPEPGPSQGQQTSTMTRRSLFFLSFGWSFFTMPPWVGSFWAVPLEEIKTGLLRPIANTSRLWRLPLHS